ncbi:MAG: DNA internalization-related competence protein ComEC/Rec2 [Lachnospiraceae bacterium]|nr:DNA internalization-related competence protein ComEC/Rec2 [Lachnospiraceae bacterium]
MNRRYLAQGAVWFLFGILFVLQRNLIFALLGVLGGGWLIYHHSRHYLKTSHRYLHGVFLLLLFAMGVFRGLVANSCITISNQIMEQHTNICFTGTIVKKEQKQDQWRYTIDPLEFSEEQPLPEDWEGLIVVQSSTDMGRLDTTVLVEGSIRPFRRPENDGGFDEANYNQSMGVMAVVKATDLQEIKAPKILLREGLFQLRRRMAQVYDVYLPGEESGILAAMTLGEKGDLLPEAKDLFQETGISHILAISGLHISMVGMLLFRLLRKRWAPLPAATVTVVVVILYGMLTGSSISTNRAVGMFVILMIATVFGCSYDLLSALSVMAILLLWQNPLAYRQVGFVFSFGAILGVALVANPLSQTYEMLCDYRWRTHHRMDHGKQFHKNAKEVVVSALIGGIGIQLASLPLCAYFFYGFPIYVVGVNLLVLPVLGIVISLGLLGGLLGGICGAIWGLHPALNIFFYPCHLILYFYEAVSGWSLDLPMAQMIVGRPTWWQMLLYYGLLLGVVWGCYTWTKKQLDGRWERARHGNRRMATNRVRCFVVALGVMVLPLVGLLYHPTRGFEVDMLSVGQGDGIYISSPEGVDFFLDGGSTSKQQVGEYVIAPFLKYHGVAKISYWFVSHTDEDHYSGLLEVLASEIRIEHVVIPTTMEHNEGYEQIALACQAAGTKLLHIQEGQIVGTGRMRIECFYPTDPAPYTGTNENSMCLLVTTEDFCGIFTGDLGEEQEAWILRNHLLPRLQGRKVDCLKAAHHGSNGSNSEAWLDAIHPEFVMISAGKNNSYGHPGDAFLGRLKEREIPWALTATSGQIQLRKEHKHPLQVRCPWNMDP